METKKVYDQYSFLKEIKRLMVEKNEKGAFEFIKTVEIRNLDGDVLFPPLFAYNSDYIFNGLLQSRLISDEKLLSMIKKYRFIIFPESEKIIKEAKLYCGRLKIKEVYTFATKGKFISKEALENCKWTPKWIDKFLAIGNDSLNNSLMQYVDMSFEQFVRILDKDKKIDDERKRELQERNPEIKSEPSNCPSQNFYSEYQISRFYPLTPNQEMILKPYCEYQIFMHSLKKEPTYEKIITALENKYYAVQRKEIGRAIKEAKLTEVQQLEILKKAVVTIDANYLGEIAFGLLENESLTADVLIAMCKIDALDDFNMINAMFGYGEVNLAFIKHVSTMPFSHEQKQEFKTSKIFTSFDGAVKREDFTFDDYLDMLKSNCNYTSKGISDLISKFVVVPNDNRFRNNLIFNNENELKLAQLNSEIITDCLLKVNNPNSYPETLICFARTPLDCDDPRSSNHNIFRSKIKNTILTDEQFELLLQIANSFEQPTNKYVIKERDEISLSKWQDFYETIPEEDRGQYFKDSKEFKIRQNWAITINTALAEQPNLSFERLCKILETAKMFKTGVFRDTLNRIINSMAFTIPQLEKMVELGFNSLQPKLDEMRNNPNATPSPNKLATIDFENRIIELPIGSTFYVIDIKEGIYDSEGKSLVTKRIFLPKQCSVIQLDDEGELVKIYPSDYENTRYSYERSSGKLSKWNDMDWECNYGDTIIPNAVKSINDALIDQARLLKQKENK